jgi:cellulose biosynthesis protein BcsQ
MAKIIMFGNQKGGVGKSLCATITAAALGQAPFNFKVALVDLDEQKTIASLRQVDKDSYPPDLSEPFTVFDFSLPDLESRIGTLDKEFEIVVLDAAGKLDARADVLQQEISRALMFSDYLFIPFVAGFGNLSATYSYLQFVQTIQKARQLSQRPLSYRGFINQFRTRSRVNDFLMQDIQTIQETQPLPMMKNPLRDYSAFKEADTYTSFYDPLSNDNSKQNFSEWLNEFVQIIKN